MKILHINSYYSGGKFYKNLYDEQEKNQIDIDVFVPVSTVFSSSDFDYGQYTIISRNHKKNDRYIFHLKHKKIFEDIQVRFSVDNYSLIHAHSLFSNGYIAMKLKEKYDVPYVVAVRNTDVNVFFKKMLHLRKLGIKILREASQIVFLSETYRDLMISNYIPQILQDDIYNKTTVIPNGIDKFWLDNSHIVKKNIKPKSINILQIGDINRNKNVLTTVKAVELLIGKGYEVKIDVLGKIIDKKIFNKIKDLPYVNYLGFKSKEDLIEIYRDNNIFVLPSIHETFGLVYAEAMSQGLPVIYSSGQGFDKQFEEGTVGYRVLSLKPTDILKKIEMVLNDYNNISRLCLVKSHSFGWENISKKYISIYEKIVNNE